MTIVCIVCGQLREGHVHYAEGWACGRCVRRCSTMYSISIIDGKKYHKIMKGTEGVVVPFRKEAKNDAR